MCVSVFLPGLHLERPWQQSTAPAVMQEAHAVTAGPALPLCEGKGREGKASQHPGSGQHINRLYHTSADRRFNRSGCHLHTMHNLSLVDDFRGNPERPPESDVP